MMISYKCASFCLYSALANFVISTAFLSANVAAQYEDLRCKCTCLSYPKYNLPAQIYTGGVLSVDCDCLNVVVPVLNGSVMKESDLEPYCLRCDCKYEVRSTKTMQVVVCIFIVLIGGLVLYMSFILFVDPILHMVDGKKILRGQQRSDSTTELSLMSSSSPEEPKPPTSVFQRVNQVQTRWMKQVQEQRTNVFDRQDLLQ